jgi:hypothetical protein
MYVMVRVRPSHGAKRVELTNYLRLCDAPFALDVTTHVPSGTQRAARTADVRYPRRSYEREHARAASPKRACVLREEGRTAREPECD